MSKSVTRLACSTVTSMSSSRQRSLDRRLASILLRNLATHRRGRRARVHGRLAMISTKDLRDIFDEATKKASDALGDAKIPDLGRRDQTPGFLYFSIGLAFGALIGLVAAFVMTPYIGVAARQKINTQVVKMRCPRVELPTIDG